MNPKIIHLTLVSLLVILVIGCGTATTPTPLPTQPPLVITVIVTATPPPPTATSAAPTVTPMPTLPLTATVTVATPTQAVAKAATATPRPVSATRTPTRPAASPTATALPIKFGAPSLNRPIWTDTRKDEAKFPGGAVIFEWKSVGGLGGDECYLLRVTTEPVNPGPGIGTKSDYWVVGCGDQTPAGAPVKFTLESPNRPGNAPSYSSILLDTNEMWANWTITVVKNLGECEPDYRYHCKTAPISPPGQGRFLFKGG